MRGVATSGHSVIPSGFRDSARRPFFSVSAPSFGVREYLRISCAAGNPLPQRHCAGGEKCRDARHISRGLRRRPPVFADPPRRFWPLLWTAAGMALTGRLCDGGAGCGPAPGSLELLPRLPERWAELGWNVPPALSAARREISRRTCTGCKGRGPTNLGSLS